MQSEETKVLQAGIDHFKPRFIPVSKASSQQSVDAQPSQLHEVSTLVNPESITIFSPPTDIAAVGQT